MNHETNPWVLVEILGHPLSAPPYFPKNLPSKFQRCKPRCFDTILCIHIYIEKFFASTKLFTKYTYNICVFVLKKHDTFKNH